MVLFTSLYKQIKINMKSPKKENDHLKFLSLIGVPFLLVVSPIFGYFIGYWLDIYFNTKPYLSYLFLILGIVAGVREFYKLVKEFTNDDKSDH